MNIMTADGVKEFYNPNANLPEFPPAHVERVREFVISWNNPTISGWNRKFPLPLRTVEEQLKAQTVLWSIPSCVHPTVYSESK